MNITRVLGIKIMPYINIYAVKKVNLHAVIMNATMFPHGT